MTDSISYKITEWVDNGDEVELSLFVEGAEEALRVQAEAPPQSWYRKGGTPIDYYSQDQFFLTYFWRRPFMARNSKSKSYVPATAKVVSLNNSPKACNFFVEITSVEGEEVDDLLDRLGDGHFPEDGKGRGKVAYKYYKPETSESDAEDNNLVHISVWYEKKDGTPLSDKELDGYAALKPGDEIELSVTSGDDARAFVKSASLPAGGGGSSASGGRRGGGSSSGSSGPAPKMDESTLNDLADAVALVYTKLVDGLPDEVGADAILQASVTVVGGAANRASR